MEIDVTPLFTGDYSPRDYSASVAEIGASAGPTTWSHALEDSADCMLLDSEDKRAAFRAFTLSSGGWTEDEIAGWSDAELNALLIQWIAGDVRDMFPDVRIFGDIAREQWAIAGAENTSTAAISGPANLYHGDDGRIYFYAGS